MLSGRIVVRRREPQREDSKRGGYQAGELLGIERGSLHLIWRELLTIVMKGVKEDYGTQPRITRMGALQRFLDRAHLRHSRNSRLCPQISRVGLKRATLYRMMPGGHLATAIALGGVAYAATGSREAAV